MALTQVSTGGIKDGQIHTADLADGAISAVKLEATTLDQTYTLGADGTNHYTFTGEGLTGTVNDPTLYLTRGKTYRFVNGNSSGAHPFRIQTTVNGSAGTEYNTGVTNNGGAGGSTIIFEVPHSAPDVLYYQCTSHGSMGGILYVTGALADGTVTTAKLASSVSSAIAANTAKDLTALSASNLTSGTIPDARFPATLPTASAANLTAVPAANITGTLPAISGANLTNLDATNLTGTIADARFPATLPAASAANLTNVPAANITGTLPAISGANLTGISSAGRAHNLVINGAMQVAQRGTSSTSDNYQTVDRWAVWNTSVDEAPTQSQISLNSTDTGPYAAGFRKAFRITNGNQSSGASAASRIFPAYTVESQDMAKSGWNYTSSSSYVTLSFWVRASVAQNYYGYLYAFDNTRVYSFETGSLSANTWTKVTKTIPGDSNLQFDDNTEQGLYIVIGAYWGTNYTDSGNTMNQWGAWNGSSRTPVNTTTWYTTNDATFDLTGVQLEVGESATDFEHLSYAEDLTKCERYFQSVRQNIWGMTQDSNGRVLWVYPLKTEMRTGPTVSATSNQIRYGNQVNAAKAITNMSINRSGYGDAKTADFAPSGTLGGSATSAFDWQFLEPGSTSDATFHFSAEI